MKAADWDERYRTRALVWGAGPNRWVEQELAELAPGRALDLACGEGRNALWLAERGWTVRAVDFSAVALQKAHELAVGAPHTDAVEWVCADVTAPGAVVGPVELALLSYLQLPAAARRTALTAAVGALAPGGTLLVVAHDSANIAHGTGGPQDPAVLYTPADVTADLTGTGVDIERAETVSRPVEGAPRDALDVLVRARRPA